MTWLEYHKRSEMYAAEAELAARSGDMIRARELYGRAAEAETHALAATDVSKSRTIGISSISAVSLFYKADQLDEAEMLAYRWLASRHLPAFASEELRTLIQSIWSERVRRLAGVRFMPGQVIVSVKGGEVVSGGAPLDLIVEKVQTVQSLFYRTVEFLRGLPHRKRGGPTKEIQDTCRPWLFQAAPSSYQFAVAVQEPVQGDFFRPVEPKPQEITGRFLRILQATSEAPEEALPEIVPDREYRGTFLKLARNLAPTGKTFGQLSIRSDLDPRSINLLPATRQAMTQAIRRSRPTLPSAEPEQEEPIRGLLRAVHLDRDWLEVTVGNQHIRVSHVGEAVDDVIGPLVNKPVIVHVVKDARGRYHFRDIEADD
jgi:hypothetical protein